MAAVPPGHAGEGDIIILREVPYRPAIGKSVPAAPLTVKVSPEFDASVIIEATHGQIPTSAVFLTDIEVATISATASIQSVGAGVIAFGEQLTAAGI